MSTLIDILVVAAIFAAPALWLLEGILHALRKASGNPRAPGAGVPGAQRDG